MKFLKVDIDEEAVAPVVQEHGITGVVSVYGRHEAEAGSPQGATALYPLVVVIW